MQCDNVKLDSFQQCSVQQNAITALKQKRQIHSPSQGNRILTDDELASAPDNYNLTAILRIEPQQLEAVIPAASRDSPFAYAKGNHQFNSKLAPSKASKAKAKAETK